MGPSLESSTGMDISPGKEKGLVHEDRHDKVVHPACKSEGNGFGVENPFHGCGDLPDREEDLQHDIMECTDPNGHHQLVETNHQEGADSSSSFEGTISGPVNGLGLGDHEVESHYRPLPLFDELFWMRKRKLSDNWRRFSRPLSWRCKWLELKLQEFRSQVEKYDQELREYNLTKEFELEKSNLEGLNTKSLPPSFQTRRMKAMIRKRRKRVEETADIGSYTSTHNLFSYKEHRRAPRHPVVYDSLDDEAQNKRDDNKDEIDFTFGWLLRARDPGDEYFGGILWKIDQIHSKAKKLKARIDEVVGEDFGKFSTDHALASPEKEDGLHVQSHHASPQPTEEPLMPQNAVPSEEQPLIRAHCGNVKEEIQTNDEAAKEELDYFERVINQVTGKPPQELSEKPISKPTKSTNRKRKRQQTWISSSGVRRRSAAARRRRNSG